MAEAQDKKGLKIDPSDGARLRSLKESVNNSVENVLGGYKASIFAKCFPSLMPKNEAILETLRVAIIDKIRDPIYEDLQQLIDSTVAEPLEQLSTLIKNHSGPKNVKAQRPSGDPEIDMRSHDAKVLKYEKQRLIEALSQAQKKSEELLKNVKAGREQCHNNSLEIQNRLSTLAEVRAVGNSLPKDSIISYSEGLLESVEQ